MTVRKIKFACFAAAASALIAACGGGTSSVGPGMCTSLAPPQLLYPAPGMTVVPDGNFQVYVNYSVNPGIAFATPVLAPNTGPSVTGGQWSSPSPGPMPTGAATPSGTGEEWVSDIPALTSSTNYSVNVRNTSCSQTYSLGTFTTK